MFDTAAAGSASAAVYCRDRARRHVPGAAGRRPHPARTPPAGRRRLHGAQRITTAAATFALSALLAWRFGPPPNFPPTYYLAYSPFRWRGSTLCTIYCRTGSLDPCWGPALRSWGPPQWPPASAGDLLRGAAGSVILFVLYLILALTSRNGLGMGDVKLAAPLGLYLGYLGWSHLFYGGALGFVAGGVASAAPGAEKPRKQAKRSGLRALDAGSRPGRHPAASLTRPLPSPLTRISKRLIKTSSRAASA